MLQISIKQQGFINNIRFNIIKYLQIINDL